MSKAKFMTGGDSLEEMETSDMLDDFVSNVLATSDLMWCAASDSSVDMRESLGKVANGLHSEALYLRRHLDRESEARFEKLKADRPELFAD